MVGPTYGRRLKKLEIETIGDLLYHFPFRYIDYSLISPIARIQPGETVSIKGEIISIKNEYTKRGKKIQKAVLKDETGTINIVWFNQPFLVRTLKGTVKLSVSLSQLITSCILVITISFAIFVFYQLYYT